MRVYEATTTVSPDPRPGKLLESVAKAVGKQLRTGQIAIRVVVTEMNRTDWKLEVGVLEHGAEVTPVAGELFRLRKRVAINTDEFNAVLVIPTGVDAELGGHSGDGGALAVAMASVCDHLITHPNVVNASDINELPPNGLYVEGSVICRLLMGTVGLQKVRANRVLVVLEEHPDRTILEHSINAVSAARAAMGMDCSGIAKTRSLRMVSQYAKSGRAVGQVHGVDELVGQIREYEGEFDAVALSSRIGVPEHYHHDYYLGYDGEPVGGSGSNANPCAVDGVRRSDRTLTHDGVPEDHEFGIGGSGPTDGRGGGVRHIFTLSIEGTSPQPRRDYE